MGVMCVVWRYRLAVSIILVLVLCDVHASDDAETGGKVYPRRNHWAVGHLMGKKSTDEQARLEDPGGDDESVLASTGQYDMQPAFVRALEALFREKAEQRSAQRSARVSAQKDNAVHLLNRLLSTPRQLVEGRERDSRREQVEQLLSQALDMKDESS
ncbi:gastrin-releasing peptide isoform X1 [Paramisgurnus dabryanus]|uniref:gastrin-releasing peptide isoform X1 n=1 Tax=Paramisgurnus dabryanus TaxID=90735 RepID=UPI0031F3668E